LDNLRNNGAGKSRLFSTISPDRWHADAIASFAAKKRLTVPDDQSFIQRGKPFRHICQKYRPAFGNETSTIFSQLPVKVELTIFNRDFVAGDT
jgi:hypothetical protein